MLVPSKPFQFSLMLVGKGQEPNPRVDTWKALQWGRLLHYQQDLSGTNTLAYYEYRKKFYNSGPRVHYRWPFWGSETFGKMAFDRLAFGRHFSKEIWSPISHWPNDLVKGMSTKHSVGQMPVGKLFVGKMLESQMPLSKMPDHKGLAAKRLQVKCQLTKCLIAKCL